MNIHHPNPEVLIVDDNQMLLETLAKLMEIKSISYVIAQTEDEAIQACAAHPTLRHAIIDYSLGTTDGITLGRELKMGNSNLKCILFTGNAHDGIIKSAKDAGFVDVLQKPLSFAELVGAIGKG